ncbi:(R)-mandelonitrile lyase 1-like isoform X2 [Malus sylvestris]|uniref:(R)-mandelonitrile lyase 1-like isoform X2 n=1 Tax=Malus sylvestris TaxID=3752 RepID=UPI0021AC9D0B|nr:(R)-mandelonitrile lyase 1-like isoform X2 [Malus sylvestris]
MKISCKLYTVMQKESFGYRKQTFLFGLRAFENIGKSIMSAISSVLLLLVLYLQSEVHSLATPSDHGMSATGVIYGDSNGTSHWVFAKAEVILSAGTLATPQLLLPSGIGPESYLSSLNITVVRDHPFVGQFVYENPRNFINIVPPNPIEASIVTVLGITDYFYQCSLSSMPLTTPAYSLFPTPLVVNSTFTHIPSKIPGPFSHGSLTLNSSSDVRVGPNVRFNYFLDPTDLAHCVSAMKNTDDLLMTDALKPYKAQDLPGMEGFNFLGQPLPKNQTDDASFETFCRDTVASYWHYHGGCLVGKVVDCSFRLNGIYGLRVADATLFPAAPASHPQGFYLMLGRYVIHFYLQLSIFVLVEWLA